MKIGNFYQMGIILLIILLLCSNSYAGGTNEYIIQKEFDDKSKCVISEYDTDSLLYFYQGKTIFKTLESSVILPQRERTNDDEIKNTKSSPKGGCDDNDDDDDDGVTVRTSHDPNDIIGPTGYGDSIYVSGKNKMNYTILFENDPEFASSPAQEVFIEQFVDSLVNIKSYRVGNFGFADYIFEVPSNKMFYQTRIDLRDSLGIYLDFVSGVDVNRKRLFWTLRSIDPATGLIPADPLKGFLHVNDSTHVGEGFVTYTITPEDDVATGNKIFAQAEIVFDVNAPIKTPKIMRTIDLAIPKSIVEEIEKITERTFVVKWGKNYETIGSGIKDYNVYCSKNYNKFEVWIENTADTSAVFSPVEDGNYRFFSLARSNVNLSEALKDTSEIEIVVGDKIELFFKVADNTVIFEQEEDADFTIPLTTFENSIQTNRALSELSWKIAENDFLNFSFSEDKKNINFLTIKDWHGLDTLKIITSYKDLSDTLRFIIELAPIEDDPRVFDPKEEELTKLMDFETFEVDLFKYFYEPDGDQLYFTFITDDESIPLANFELIDNVLQISSISNTIGSVKITVTASDEIPNTVTISNTKNRMSKNNITINKDKPDIKISSKNGSVSKIFNLNIKLPYAVPYLVTDIQDIIRDINFNDFVINLNDYFKTIDTHTLSYTLLYDSVKVNCEITDSLLSIHSKDGLLGEAQITVTATDNELQTNLVEVFNIDIQEINSAPLEPLQVPKIVYFAFANYGDEADDMKMQFDTGDNVAFKVLNSSGEEINIGDYGTLTYFDYIKKALENYFYTMSNGKLNLTVEILRSKEPNEVWKLKNRSYYESEIPKYLVRSAIISDLKAALSVNPDYVDYLIQDEKDNEDIFINYILPDYDDKVGYIRGNNTETQLETGVSFDKITRKLAQQLAQTLFAVGVKGYELTESHFDGYISNDFMGRAGSQTGPYDLMFKWNKDYAISPYSLYGLNPIHSQDLMNQGYIDSEIIVADESQLLEIGANSFTVRLNGIRNTVVKTQTKSKAKESLTGKLIKIPVTALESDLKDSALPEGSMTKNQYFLVEYKNPSGYDELSPYELENQSTGVLISHVINGDGGDIEGDFKSAVVDIEAAIPFPAGYRTSTDGLFYNGREVNDWLDDFNDLGHEIEGGMSYPDQTKRTCSLPEDFFNNTDRNKFTPATIPSTDSWKQNDTHIGVFIDDINYDLNYADLRVYRNYWSKPIEAGKIVNIEGIGYFGENFSIGSGADLTIGSLSDKPVVSSYTVITGSQMTIGAYSKLNLINDTSLIIEEGSNLIFEEQSSLTFSGTSRIIGDIVTTNLASFEVKENSILNFGLSDITIASGTKLKLNANAKLTVENAANLYFQEGSSIEIGDGAQIIIKNKGKLSAGSSVLGLININIVSTNTDTNEGIICEGGSTLELSRIKVTGSGYAVDGLPFSCSINYCSFENCGINIINCNYYTIENNTFTGNGTGTGVSMTLVSSTGTFKSNNIQNYRKGMEITLCSPKLVRNTIKNNKNYGLYVTGYDANPQLINPLTTKVVLNNQIINNGVGTLYDESAQIFMKYSANAYMSNGYNNIYSGTAGTIPRVPCIRTVNSNYVELKETLPLMTYINAQYNYWGYSAISELLFNKFFDIWADGTSSGYILLYEPYGTIPYRTGLPIPNPVHISPVVTLLSNAIRLEEEGNFTPAIKLYENIIDKYEGSAEYYVALVRLPDIYIEQELAVDPLIDLYNDEIDSLGGTGNTKFFKELRVSTHIKDRRYDEAILLGEEMKTEAQSEGEILLAEIDIAVAKIMKASGSAKCDIVDYLSNLNALLGKLKGEELSTESTENLLPDKFTLHQNYPNPFNPTTIIKYDLPEDSNVKIMIYNTQGALIASLVNSHKTAGYHQVEFDASRISNGVYYYVLKANNKIVGTKKMVMVK